MGVAQFNYTHFSFLVSLLVVVSVSGYTISIQSRLLSGSHSGYELRRKWESFFFPGLSQDSASVNSGYFPLPIIHSFQRLPAGHRPDTLVLKYIPISWVDGSLLVQAPTHSKLKLYGTMEEDETGALSEPERGHADDEDEDDESFAPNDGTTTSGGVRPPSLRRRLRVVKRQLELLLRPAGKVAHLPDESITIRRWEYQPIDMSIWARKKRLPTMTASSDSTIAPVTSVNPELNQIDDQMLLCPLLNPFAAVQANHADLKGENGSGGEEHKSVASSSASSIPHMIPLCHVYIMLNDYPALLACFEYLHNKRLRNRLDESDSNSTDSTLPSNGRLIDYVLEVDTSGYLRYDRIEERRQLAHDELERLRAAEQLARHTARKRAEEVARLERERKVREEEAAAEVVRLQVLKERQQSMMVEQQAQRQREEEAQREATARRQAELDEKRLRLAEERERQHQRREEQERIQRDEVGIPFDSHAQTFLLLCFVSAFHSSQ